MEKVYAHRAFGLEANIIGCATYEVKIGKFEFADIGQLGGYVVSCLVYHLFGLTYDEVLIVDPKTPITREEYENR